MKNNRKIVILERGWVFVGLWQEVGKRVVLTQASCIRVWGTSAGIGQLALTGPLKDTKLDPSGTVSFQLGTEIAALECQTENWP